MKKMIQENEYDSMMFHPYNVLLFLSLASITALFMAFSISFVYSRIQGDIPPIKLPLIFYFNTFLLIGTSISLWWAKKSYLEDHTTNYQKALVLTIILTLSFMILQVFGWNELVASKIFLASDNAASFLYIISGLHFVHVIAGLPFLILFLFTARKRMQEPVSVLVYFSDPAKKLKLRLLTIYWHFLDGLWIYLVLFFGINYLLS
ncbi:MAG: heme-copper oxidase subunit III [Saprospiraceae bacterium]